MTFTYMILFVVIRFSLNLYVNCSAVQV